MPVNVQAIYYSSEDALEAVMSSLGLTAGDVHEIMAKKTKGELLKHHNHKIWLGDDGRWRTFLPDPSKAKNRRLISRATREALEDVICEYYQPIIAAEELTLNNLLEEWLDAKTGTVDIQSIEHNRKDWRRYYEGEPIINKPISTISGRELNKWVHAMIDKHQMTPHKWRNFICILRQMLSYAFEEQYIAHNPFDSVKVDKGLRLYPEEDKANEKEVFTTDEMCRIIDYCWHYYCSGKALKQRYVPLAIIYAAYAGPRLGEIAALRFDDIEQGEVEYCRIRRQVNTSLKATVPYAKQHKNRRIISPTKASEVIAEIKRDRLERGLPIDSYIFCPDDNVNATYLRIRNFIYDVCDALDIPRRSMHNIRKTTISNMYDKVNINTIRNQVGHADKQTTINNYVFDTSVDKSKLAAIDAALDF